MFFAAHQDGSYSPLELSGVGNSEAIKQLQTSLQRLSSAIGRPHAAPGPTTGILNEQTMVSIASLLDKISPNLPMWVVHPLGSSMTQGVSSIEAKNTVGRYVTEVRYATDQAFAQLPQLPAQPTFSLSGPSFTFFEEGWYRSPARLSILGGLILLGFWIYSHIHQA